MAPEIDVDDEVWAAVQAEAVPFEDTPNSALRRLLGMGGGEGSGKAPKQRRARKPGRRASPGSILPESEYGEAILRTLAGTGGRAHADDVMEAVGEALAGRLKPMDRERTESGELRWRNRVHHARLGLKRRGLIDPDQPRGVWALTDEGEAAARELE